MSDDTFWRDLEDRFEVGQIVVPDPRAKYITWSRAKLLGPKENGDDYKTIPGKWRGKDEKGNQVIISLAHVLPAVQDGECLVDW